MNNAENTPIDLNELSEKILQGIRKAARKLVETSAANGDSLVVSDKEGNIKTIPAKDLLDSIRE